MKEKGKIVFIIGLVMLFMSSILSASAATILYNSSDVSFDNTSSGLTATNVQDAIDELQTKANTFTSIQTDVDNLYNNKRIYGAFYKGSGRTSYSTSDHIFMGYGFVTTNSTKLLFIVPFVWSKSINSVSVTKILTSFRISQSGGGYIEGDLVDLSSYVTSYDFKKENGVLIITLVKSGGFKKGGTTTNVTDYSSFCGYAKMDMTITYK